MQALAGVVLHVQAGDADALLLAFGFDIQIARERQRQLVHRNLVALGQVGVEIVFARKTRVWLDFAVNGQRSAQSQLERAFIKHRQRPGQTEAHGAGIGIRRRAKFCRAAAKGLGDGLELGVHFEADDGFVARHYVRRDARRFLCGSDHGEWRNYNTCPEFEGEPPSRERFGAPRGGGRDR